MPDPDREQIYLDWNATTPPHPEVLRAMQEALSHWGNPASVHSAGRAARRVVETARERLAAELGVDPRDVVFTSGGTEANNLALHAVPYLVTSRLEHPSVIRRAEALATQGRVSWLPVSPGGQVRAVDLETALAGAPQGTWVCVTAANHETGVLEPVAELCEVAHGRGALLHVDAVQALGKTDLADCATADSISVCAHKLRGPRGIGALAWRRARTPKPLLLGGTQERGFRPGTQDPALAAGFAAALDHIDLERFAGLGSLRDRLEDGLADLGLVNGERAARLPHVTNLSFPGLRGDELVAALDLQGICVSAGSACSAGTTEPSPVITSMLGLERATSAVRFSLGELTTAADIERVLAVVRALVSGAF